MGIFDGQISLKFRHATIQMQGGWVRSFPPFVYRSGVAHHNIYIYIILDPVLMGSVKI